MDIGSSEWIKCISQGASCFGLKIPLEAESFFADHARILLKWNKKINLTAITDPKEVAIKHILDAIIPSPLILPNSKVLDIGSGGGFPGIPLKIMCGSLKMTLVDSVRKKVNFLKQVIRELNLKNIEALHFRAEVLAEKPEYAQAFDVVVCRALSSLEDFINLAHPFLKPGGEMIALKGKVSASEINALHTHFPNISIDLKTYKLPVFNADRSLVKIKF